MDYSSILQALQQASLFDLYRLRVGIDNMLDQPDRLQRVRQRMQPGMTITWFDGRQNRLTEAIVEEVQRTNVHVRDKEGGKKWRLPLYMVNLAGADTDIHAGSGAEKLDKNQLKVGDAVGYRDRQNREVYGTLVQLNPKTATVVTRTGERWRVSYGMLFKVMDGEGRHEPDAGWIEGEILQS
ncbi:hypothetical protein SIID45300_01369 [Candidatus Magnetaquicoccaceae bacterium FCR-1]|uniref:Uncharacterized protein n=1 Tax=Candidatus Magnetaquiglobus chichijimensis TaxID=3141448 RepID=A0ABQ0C835_9PROT